MMRSLAALFPWLAFTASGGAAAFTPPVLQPLSDRLSTTTTTTTTTSLSGISSKQQPKEIDAAGRSSSTTVDDGRRAFLSKTLTAASAAAVLPYYLIPASPANAASVPVQRAVGSAESKCREEGNCLETLELDGAVGWQWGGKDRCDARDPMCGADGRLREEALRGMPVPAKDDELEITDIVELALTIGSGSNSDSQTMKFGLYGKRCPELVKQMTDLCGRGLVTSRDLLLGAPVRLGVGGSMTYIRPGERLEFGVASQRVAYAKSIRKAKAPDEFVPQGRPSEGRLAAVRGESSARDHGAAGLVSVPRDGMGYGGGIVMGKDDEAYASAFQITAAASVPDMDREGRKVIGQLIDAGSMDLLARLAGIPPRKLIPGQNGGAPLIKVSVDDCAIYSVADLVAKE